MMRVKLTNCNQDSSLTILLKWPLDKDTPTNLHSLSSNTVRKSLESQQAFNTQG